MKYAVILSSVILFLIVFALSCGQSTAPGGLTDAPVVRSVKPSGEMVQADWQKKWEGILAAAKQEGEILIYLNATPGARDAIANAFNLRFGLKADFIMGSGIQLQTRLQTEQKAGINQVDMVMAGAVNSMNLKAGGIPLEPILPVLILPEVKDPRVWIGSELPFFDPKDGKIVAFLSQVSPDIVRNTDLVKEGQITSYLDLLKPEFKGKLAVFDPAITGAANAGAAQLAVEWGSNEKVYDYIVSLIKQQEAVLTRDQRQQVEWVARGKYAVAVWPASQAVSDFLQIGAPLAGILLKERGRITASNGSLVVPARRPHPNAAVVFLNWLLSREGQTMVVKTYGAPSTRIDVPAEGVLPINIPDPTQKYHVATEESSLARAPFTEGLKKVMGGL